LILHVFPSPKEYRKNLQIVHYLGLRGSLSLSSTSNANRGQLF